VKAFIAQNKIFVLCTLLLCIWYIDVWENSNSCSRVLPVATYFEQGNFVLDKYKDEVGELLFRDNGTRFLKMGSFDREKITGLRCCFIRTLAIDIRS
jgi:hypothetical protein